MNTPLFIIGIVILTYALFLGIFWIIRDVIDQRKSRLEEDEMPATKKDIKILIQIIQQHHEDLLQIIERMDKRITLLEERNKHTSCN